ncbi:MAG TPA: YMGG-like glycine zipper-containing protein [Steroidobacteraceae bacterium]|nr:YMGG-like glycine zipper-containing protein [Steroidobacteraceae bacterium]
MNPTMSRALRLTLAGALLSALCACETAPPPRPARPPPPPPTVNTTVYAYPLNGQPPEQVDRDRYECYVWANKQTGFDPSAANVPPHDRVAVVTGSGAPPGTGAAVGAVAGAVLGAAVSRPYNAGPGAVVGAVIGSMVGASAQASQDQQTREVYVRDRREMAQIEQKAADYRRALSACLEGRGYSVR